MNEQNTPNVPQEIYKTMEFEAFLKQIGSGSIRNWSILAEALGVDRHTIIRWKQHPMAQAAINAGIEEALRKMTETGGADWKMWREQAKMLGVKDKQVVENDASDEVKNVLDKLETDYAKLGQQAFGQVVAINPPLQNQGQAGAGTDVQAQPDAVATPS